MSDSHHDNLVDALALAAHLLPAQMPIERFVHHNTLHAFEDLPFEQAVLHAHDLFGAQPYMDEDSFRQAYAQGRITMADLDDVLDRATMPELSHPLPPGLTLKTIIRSWMLHLPTHASGTGISWFMEEHDVLGHYPLTLPQWAHERLVQRGAAHHVLPELWRACEDIALPPPTRERAESPRLVAALCAATGSHMDRLIEPDLIRFAAAYLDQGISHWSAPERAQGFFDFATRQCTLLVPDPTPWRRLLRQRLKRYASAKMDSEAVIHDCLRAQGMQGELSTQITHTLLALPGWAGMFSMIERRPDTAPVLNPPPATLRDFLAVRLCMECACLESLVPTGDPDASFASRLATPDKKLDAPPQQDTSLCFNAMVHIGVSAVDLAHLTPQSRHALTSLLRDYDSIARRALWQLAYERHYRVHMLDAVLAHGASTPHTLRQPTHPEVQIVMCIDDREESLRRHIEELEPTYETLGAGGFFGVAMHFRAHHSPSCVPLCPPSVTPTHYVHERLIHAEHSSPPDLTTLYMNAHTQHGTTLISGGLTSLFGLHKLLPMMTRILSPKTSRKLFSPPDAFNHTHTKLVIHRTDDTLTREGWVKGYSHEEMAQIVMMQLQDLGLITRFAPLVAMIGHGSTSVNNPHGAGYGCGACGGGHGGPNGRAFAHMANLPEVRALLIDQGITIPDSTWFIGGYHNTTNNDVDFYDLDELPETHLARFEALTKTMIEARRLDAAERCRRFESAPLTLTPTQALDHVEARAEDLAQPRPEYGHTANALCVVGRRSWTRDLFLDRRAFLVSYDPQVDDEQRTILTRLLGSMGPVGAGINLEYYFSRVDNARYGSGSKLPHNVSGMVGVMNGHSSDLRTGLPWQMVELHEPIRLTVLIEGTPEQVARLVEGHAALKRLVHNRWILAAVYDPETNQAWFLEPDGFEAHTPDEHALAPHTVTRSSQIYAAQRELIHPVTIRTAHTQTRPNREHTHVA